MKFQNPFSHPGSEAVDGKEPLCVCVCVCLSQGSLQPPEYASSTGTGPSVCLARCCTLVPNKVVEKGGDQGERREKAGKSKKLVWNILVKQLNSSSRTGFRHVLCPVHTSLY